MALERGRGKLYRYAHTGKTRPRRGRLEVGDIFGDVVERIYGTGLMMEERIEECCNYPAAKEGYRSLSVVSSLRLLTRRSHFRNIVTIHAHIYSSSCASAKP